MIPGRQFRLRSLLVATALIALACAAARYFATTHYALRVAEYRELAFFSIPVILCGAVGVLRGRLLTWLIIGAAIDVGILIYSIADTA
jgi:hypothetical protein